MNQYLEHNLKEREKIMKHRDRMEEQPFHNLTGFKCLFCGEYLSPETIEFYSYDIERSLCYSCQEKNVDLKTVNQEMEESADNLEEDLDKYPSIK